MFGLFGKKVQVVVRRRYLEFRKLVVEAVKMHGVHENLLQNWTFSGGDENFSMSLLFPSAFAVPWARTAEVSSDREGDFGGKSPITPPLQRMSLSKKAFFFVFQ